MRIAPSTRMMSIAAAAALLVAGAGRPLPARAAATPGWQVVSSPAVPGAGLLNVAGSGPGDAWAPQRWSPTESTPAAGISSGTSSPSPRPAPGQLASPRVTPRSSGIVAFVDPASVSPAAFGADISGTSDGGYVVAGSVGVNHHDGWVGKLAASGRLQWQHQFGCGASNLLSVEQTADGGYILAGGSEGCAPACASGGFGNLDCAWVVKLSAAGKLEWQKVFPGTFQASADQIRQTSDGGYIVAGSTYDGSGTTYAWVAKLDAGGTAQWQRQIGSAAFASAQAVQQTSDGGYIVAGSSGVIGSSSALVVKLDARGNPQWQKGYGVGYEDFAKSIAQTPDGGYVVAGTDATQAGGTGYDDAFLMKLDPSGTIVWQKRYNGQGRCTDNACYDGGSDARAVRPTADGGYILAGLAAFHLVNPPVPASTSWLVKTDARGNIVWQRVFYQVNPATGLPYSGAFYGLSQTSDGGFVAAGYNDRYHVSDNVWVVKTTAAGNIPGCPVARPSLLTALNAGLSASALRFPVSTAPVAGATVTGKTIAGGLTAHQVC